MKQSLTLLIVCIFSLLSCFEIIAQNNYIPNNTGAYINFNLLGSTLKDTKAQQISLYGCNTSITLDNTSITGPKNVNNQITIKGPKGFVWEKENQIVSGIPFGYQTDTITHKKFYISKYYIASPPIIKKNTNITKTSYDLGLVTPDAFTLKGDKPTQLVYLNYNILKEIEIAYIPVKFLDSFDKLNVNLVPFNVSCNDFPWRDKNGIINAKGASGVGALNKKEGINQLFLPYIDNNAKKDCLNCKVTILNDILLDHKIFFVIDGKKRETINLKEYHQKKGKDAIKLKVVKTKKTTLWLR